MPFAIGSFAALVALAAGILSHVDSLASLWRALLAFFVGWACASVWQALTSINRSYANEEASPASIESAETS